VDFAWRRRIIELTSFHRRNILTDLEEVMRVQMEREDETDRLNITSWRLDAQ